MASLDTIRNKQQQRTALNLRLPSLLLVIAARLDDVCQQLPRLFLSAQQPQHIFEQYYPPGWKRSGHKKNVVQQLWKLTLREVLARVAEPVVDAKNFFHHGTSFPCHSTHQPRGWRILGRQHGPFEKKYPEKLYIWDTRLRPGLDRGIPQRILPHRGHLLPETSWRLPPNETYVGVLQPSFAGESSGRLDLAQPDKQRNSFVADNAGTNIPCWLGARPLW